MAEIHTVGSLPILQQVVTHCLGRGARPASPGEFTLRAFLNGRLDLTRAEAVLGVIEADDAVSLAVALQQLAGGLATPISALRDRLLNVLADLEAQLDFGEEPDVDPLERHALAGELESAARSVQELVLTLQGRDRPDATPRVVLIGPPNVGKSQLFNALLGSDQALVSPHAGTTRDYLTGWIDCEGLKVELIDTAGIDEPRDAVERTAQGLRDDVATVADLLLECRTADAPDLVSSREVPSIRVWTKCDLYPPDSEALPTSARTGEGLEALRSTIARRLRGGSTDGSAVALTGARCRDSLRRAERSLRLASEALTLHAGDEIVAMDLRQALDDLGLVVGAVVTDDILDRIFQRFCIGK
jgi:tRNA modification GTPase